MFPKTLAAAAALSGVAAIASMPASAGQTFDAVKAKGFVQCAVNTGLAGFSFSDSQGKWTGLDVDLCRAIAVAMFGDAEKAKYTPTTAQQRFVALQSGEVDVITRNATQTLLRDTSLGFNMAGVNFYDGQGFIVPTKSGLKSAKELTAPPSACNPARRRSSTSRTISARTR
jgi:general L-amino acid transport system substrate-binding protein